MTLTDIPEGLQPEVEGASAPAAEAPSDAPAPRRARKAVGGSKAKARAAVAEAERPAAEDVETDAALAPAEPEGAPQPQIPDEAEWFVIHTYSGYENKVKKNLEHRIESMGMLDQIFQVVVPVEEEVDIKDGQRRIVERKIFPGYVLVRMLMNDESWSVVRNTPAVTGFVGSGESERLRPTPLRKEEVDKILRRMEAEEPTIRVSFRVGQNVRIVDGPFTDFHGIVDAIDVERGKVRLMVNFFGRETPVELDFLQVERV